MVLSVLSSVELHTMISALSCIGTLSLTDKLHMRTDRAARAGTLHPDCERPDAAGAGAEPPDRHLLTAGGRVLEHSDAPDRDLPLLLDHRAAFTELDPRAHATSPRRGSSRTAMPSRAGTTGPIVRDLESSSMTA